MTIEEFVEKYNGKGIDFDGYYGDQCMDLYRQYLKEVLEVPQTPPVVGAKDIWYQPTPENFERVENTPNAVPSLGDIIIWGTVLGTFGHVAIFLEGNVNRFKSFDQNFPIGSKCHIQEHNYRGVLGWLKPVNDIINQMPNYQNKAIELFEKYRKEREQGPEGNWEAFARAVIQSDMDINTLQIAYKQRGEQLTKAQADIDGLKAQIKSLEEKLSEGGDLNVGNLVEKWDDLPKEVKVLPYLIISAVVTVLVDYLTTLKVDNVIIMAAANIVLVFLQQTRSRIGKISR